MPTKHGPKALSETDLEGLEPFLDAITERQRHPGTCDGCGRPERIFTSCPDCLIASLTGVRHAAHR